MGTHQSNAGYVLSGIKIHDVRADSTEIPRSKKQRT